jgi:hypothetical protein
MRQTYHSDRSFDNEWGGYRSQQPTQRPRLNRFDSSDRKEDACVSQIDW